MTTSLEKGICILLESTSNGKSNLFYELCNDAIKKANDFTFIFIPWFWHSEYINNDIANWDVPKAWIEYKKQYELSLQQLKWAYLKNQILCKVTGESNSNGPSVYFKREFPASHNEAFLNNKSDNTLLPLDELIKASISVNDLQDATMAQSPKVIKFKQKRLLQKNKEIVLGVDVARGGGDLSWIIDRQGDFLGFNLNQKISLNDSMQVAYWVAKHIQAINPSKVFIDAGGLGISVVDRLKELGFNNVVIAVNFASRANNSSRFLNKRAEIWFLLKEFINNGGYIINDPMLLKQISSIKGFYNLKGQLQLEDKQSIRASLKQSPDGGDAAALTFVHSEAFNNIIMGTINNTDYDPFNW